MRSNDAQTFIGGPLQNPPTLLFGQVLVHVEDLMPFGVAHENVRQTDGVAQHQELILAVGDLDDHVAGRMTWRGDSLNARCDDITVAECAQAIAIRSDAAASESEEWA
jgi:hypothetical protein